MIEYDINDLKNNLQEVCNMLLNKQKDKVVVIFNGKPVVQIVPYKEENVLKPGCLKDKYGHLCDIDWFNDDIENIFFEQ